MDHYGWMSGAMGITTVVGVLLVVVLLVTVYKSFK
jgi:hypothetical protein